MRINLLVIGYMLSLKDNTARLPMVTVDVARSVDSSRVLVDGTYESDALNSAMAGFNDVDKIEAISFRESTQISYVDVDLTAVKTAVDSGDAEAVVEDFSQQVELMAYELFNGYSLNDLGRFEFSDVNQKDLPKSFIIEISDYDMNNKTGHITKVTRVSDNVSADLGAI